MVSQPFKLTYQLVGALEHVDPCSITLEHMLSRNALEDLFGQWLSPLQSPLPVRVVEPCTVVKPVVVVEPVTVVELVTVAEPF